MRESVLIASSRHRGEIATAETAARYVQRSGPLRPGVEQRQEDPVGDDEPMPKGKVIVHRPRAQA